MAEEKKSLALDIKELIDYSLNQGDDINKLFLEYIKEGESYGIIPFLLSPYVEKLNVNYVSHLRNPYSKKDLGNGNALSHLLESYLFNLTINLEDQPKNRKKREIINKMLSNGFDYKDAFNFLNYFATLKFDQLNYPVKKEYIKC